MTSDAPRSSSARKALSKLKLNAVELEPTCWMSKTSDLLMALCQFATPLAIGRVCDWTVCGDAVVLPQLTAVQLSAVFELF